MQILDKSALFDEPTLAKIMKSNIRILIANFAKYMYLCKITFLIILSVFKF